MKIIIQQKGFLYTNWEYVKLRKHNFLKNEQIYF